MTATPRRQRRPGQEGSDLLQDVLAWKSPFLQQLQLQEQNLQQELFDLDQTRQRLEREIHALEREKSKLAQDFQDLEEFERKLIERGDRAFSALAIKHSVSETQKQIEALENIVANLRATVDSAKQELQTARDRDRQHRFEPERLRATTRELFQQPSEFDGLDEQPCRDESTDPDVINQQIRERTQQIDKQKKRLDELQKEVIQREMEAYNVEKAARDHEVKLEETRKRKAALDARRKKAEQKKKQFERNLEDRDRRTTRVIAQRNRIRERKAEAEQEQLRLDQLENDLRQQELQLNDQWERDALEAKQQGDEFQRREIEKMDKEKREREQKQREIARQDRVTDFITKYERDGVAIERKYDRLTTAARQRKLQIELEQSKWMELWGTKHAEMDREIEKLRAELAESEAISTIRLEMKGTRQEYEELLQKMADDQDKFRRLAEEADFGKIATEEKATEIKEEKARIARVERELELEDVEQTREEEELQREEEQLERAQIALQRKLEVLQIREKAAKQMLETYQQSWETAERRYEFLRQKLNQMQPASE